MKRACGLPTGLLILLACLRPGLGLVSPRNVIRRRSSTLGRQGPVKVAAAARHGGFRLSAASASGGEARKSRKVDDPLSKKLRKFPGEALKKLDERTRVPRLRLRLLVLRLVAVASALRRSRGFKSCVFVAFVFAGLQLRPRIMGVPPKAVPVEVPYSSFMHMLKQQSKSVSDVRVSVARLTYFLNGKPAFTRPVRAPAELISLLFESGVDFRAQTGGGPGILPSLLFPLLWLFGMNSVIKKQMTGATGSVATRAKKQAGEVTSFEDVAGVDGAKREVQEIVSMLKNPARYAQAGARLPSGVLMVGPPGTGKTLLARAMAAQAQVPFFFCSGSDFVELFVGRGAARMRSLFKEAEKVAPCIIFVDEIDALGKQRSMRLGGSDEVEQTLNQMLACMDGLESTNNGVIVMGATNRYEILDPALTRPGRFDRLVRIPLPDENGRLAILRVHTRKLLLGPDMRLDLVAAATPGFSGAELAALANEAAIRAVRRDKDVVIMDDFKGALDVSVKSRRAGIETLLSKLTRPG